MVLERVLVLLLSILAVAASTGKLHDHGDTQGLHTPRSFGCFVFCMVQEFLFKKSFLTMLPLYVYILRQGHTPSRSP